MFIQLRCQFLEEKKIRRKLSIIGNCLNPGLIHMSMEFGCLGERGHEKDCWQWSVEKQQNSRGSSDSCYFTVILASS